MSSMAFPLQLKAVRNMSLLIRKSPMYGPSDNIFSVCMREYWIWEARVYYLISDKNRKLVVWCAAVRKDPVEIGSVAPHAVKVTPCFGWRLLHASRRKGMPVSWCGWSPERDVERVRRPGVPALYHAQIFPENIFNLHLASRWVRHFTGYMLFHPAYTQKAWMRNFTCSQSAAYLRAGFTSVLVAFLCEKTLNIPFNRVGLLLHISAYCSQHIFFLWPTYCCDCTISPHQLKPCVDGCGVTHTRRPSKGQHCLRPSDQIVFCCVYASFVCRVIRVSCYNLQVVKPLICSRAS